VIINAPRLIIAGTGSNVGKTTMTLALLAAFTACGRVVQPFKAGPDFIDPGHHGTVTGRLSRTLDGWMLEKVVNRSIFARAAADANLSIIEGMMGLFDGSSPVSEVGSTAEIAKQLGAPVLLVVDGSAMARSAAAIVKGFADFDPGVRVAGVLFNRVNSEGHYRLLKEAVEQQTNVVVMGHLRPDKEATIPHRHLGLVTAMEQGSVQLYHRLGQAATDTIDLDRVEMLARSAGALPVPVPASVTKSYQGRSIRIGIARDPAFCFYYADNLDLLEAQGAEMAPFSPVKDQALPDVDMLYLGGGYPELHAGALAANVPMRHAIRAFAERGGTVFAECGGMMYLTQAIRDLNGRAHEMVGLFQAEAVMQKARFTLGYRTVELSRSCILGEAGVTARGHEFHYSALVPTGDLDYACRLSDAQGKSRGPDGLVMNHTVALYTHLHFASNPDVARSLAESACRSTGARARLHTS